MREGGTEVMSEHAHEDVDHRPAALADTAFAKLRADLLCGGPLTGARRLVAGELARQLGVSRTPVREALDRLARLGHLTRLDGGGYERRRYRTRDIRDVYELRLLLEPYAAGLAAEESAELPQSSSEPVIRCPCRTGIRQPGPDPRRRTAGRTSRSAAHRHLGGGADDSRGLALRLGRVRRAGQVRDRAG